MCKISLKLLMMSVEAQHLQFESLFGAIRNNSRMNLIHALWKRSI